MPSMLDKISDPRVLSIAMGLRQEKAEEDVAPARGVYNIQQDLLGESMLGEQGWEAYKVKYGSKKTAEVEQFKLTPEQVKFQKQYKLLKAKQALLEGATLQTQEKIRTLRGLWGELTGEFDKLQVPQAPVEEFEGMEEGTEPAVDKNWQIEY